eukprot:6904298-Alexandrium_andersonii.AAC.1
MCIRDSTRAHTKTLRRLTNTLTSVSHVTHPLAVWMDIASESLRVMLERPDGATRFAIWPASA